MIWPFKKAEKRSDHAILTLLRELYTGVNGRDLSVGEREARAIQDTSLTYGEVRFDSFRFMLKTVEPTSGETFYDLGCGVGKPVFMAALLQPFRYCYGVETLDTLFDVCKQQLIKFEQMLNDHPDVEKPPSTIDFFHGNLFEYDFYDADVIFVSATCFIGEQWQQLVSLLDKTKSGTRIMLTSKQLTDREKYIELFSGFLPMSWGECTVNIYRRV